MFGIYRFILALNVVLFHTLAVPKIGPLAVYSFFILSGYLMTLIMHKTYGYSVSGIRKYAINRFFRLYPFYWTLLLVTIFIIFITGENHFTLFHNKMRLPSNIPEILANITMIYPELKPGDYQTRLAPATWAITIELFFYFLIGIGISKTKLRTITWFALSMLVLIYNNIALKELGFGYGSYLTASLPFSMGALLFFYKESMSKFFKNIPIINLPILIFIFILNLILCSTANFINLDYVWKINVVCTGLNLLLSAIMVIKLSNIKTQHKSIKAIDKLTGDLSYPVYIFHWTGACLASWLLFSNPDKGFSTFLLGITLTIIISLIVNKVINDKVELIRCKIKENKEKVLMNT